MGLKTLASPTGNALYTKTYWLAGVMRAGAATSKAGAAIDVLKNILIEFFPRSRLTTIRCVRF
jgi:hypothetical protein